MSKNRIKISLDCPFKRPRILSSRGYTGWKVAGPRNREMTSSTRTLTREVGGRTHVVERAVDPLAALTVDEQATEQDLALAASLENRGRGNPHPYP
jgi:hypothetical protein